MKGLTFKEIENIINSEELKLYSRWGKHEEIDPERYYMYY